MKIAHISDLHFGRKVSRTKEQALATDLKRQDPDLIAITGDITDQGFVYQFRWALSFLESVSIPYIIVPGNREVSPAAIWEWLFPRLAMRRFGRFFGQKDRIVRNCDGDGIVFFGLNSVHPFPSWPGKIARETRYWFKEQVASYPQHIKVLLLHHPVLPVIRGSSFWAHFLSDAGEVLNIATESGVSLILQGHKHRSAIMEVRVPQRNARVVVSACGAPLMPYWDSTYHIVSLNKTAIEIQPREFKVGAFEGGPVMRFPLYGE
jgi:3',5'-cyclic-AMP phosphodiesterase